MISRYRITGIIVGVGIGFAFGYGVGCLGQAVSDNPTGPSSLYCILLIISAIVTGKITRQGRVAALLLLCVGGPCIGLSIATGGDWAWYRFTEFGPYYLSLVVLPFIAFGALVGYVKLTGLGYRIAQLDIWRQGQGKSISSQLTPKRADPALPASHALTCASCKNKIPVNVNFCAYCGRKVATFPKAAPFVHSLPFTPMPMVRRAKHGIPTWSKWLIGLVATALVVIPVYMITYNPFADPLDKAYDGAYRWAERNLPSEEDVTIPESGFPTDATVTMESHITYCILVGQYAWVVAYYGLKSYDDTRLNPEVALRELFPPTGYILHSSDGGDKWEVQKLIPDWRPLRIEFVTETEGYAVGDSGILYTAESGKNWSFLALPTEIKKIEEVKSIEAHHLVIACNDEWVKYESFDGGITWEVKPE